MKRVSSSRRLQLNKETLRTLTPEEMQAAAGATGFFCNIGVFPTVICIGAPVLPTKGPLSFGCTSIVGGG